MWDLDLSNFFFNYLFVLVKVAKVAFILIGHARKCTIRS